MNDELFRNMILHESGRINSFLEKRDPFSEISNRCAYICHHIIGPCSRLRPFEASRVALTVGAVHHKGENTFNVTRDSVISVMKIGYNPKCGYRIHAWLTVENMTILDPTILANLLKNEKISGESYVHCRTLVHDPDVADEFEFTPFLVDNSFFVKTDGLISR
jgi:hypothetical protein